MNKHQTFIQQLQYLKRKKRKYGVVELNSPYKIVMIGARVSTREFV